MNYKFIYCTDIDTKNKLDKELDLVLEKEINGKTTWIFENNNQINFSEVKDKITYSNKFYI